jgi:uncharacterized delta-60 repeat protein
MKNTLVTSVLVLIGMVSSPRARAQLPASLDPTFGDGGKVWLDVGTVHNEAYAVAVQPDGKIIVAGNNRNTQTDAIILARYTPSGALDPTFGNGGVVVQQLGQESCTIRAIALQPDGQGSRRRREVRRALRQRFPRRAIQHRRHARLELRHRWVDDDALHAPQHRARHRCAAGWEDRCRRAVQPARRCL